jgi:hypothetical protein
VPGLRLTVGSLLGVIGLLIAMVCLSSGASAAPNITISYAGPDTNGNPYDLSVTANDGNGLAIQSMTAHVFNTAMTDVADVPMTAVSTANPAAQTWVAASLISESALPAGTYTVTVDASDADENDTALPAPGFSFAYVSSNLTVTAEPPSVTQGSQNVTFSGTLTGTAQGATSTPIGIAGAPVLLSIGGGTPFQVATTGANGNFSYQQTGITQSSDYDFTVAATATYPAAGDDVTVNAVQSTTSMTVLPTAPTVTEGSQQVTFTGAVSVTPPASQTATGIGSGVPVYLSVGGGTATPVTTTDDANGDYSYTVTGITAGANYVFSVVATSLYTAASATSVVGTQAAPSTMIVTAAPQFITYGSQSVTFSGTVKATPADGSAIGLGSGVPVFLSVGGGTATQVTTTNDASGDFTYTASGLTTGADYTFSVQATNLYTAATYQVPVDLDPGTTSVTATASPPDVNLASSTVVFSGTVGVTPFGTTNSTGLGSGIPVYLSVGGGTATQVTTTDDASGDFSYTATGVHQAADYVFSVQAGTFYSAGSDSVPIGTDQVNSTLAVTASPASVTEGSESVTFTGTLTGVSPDSKSQTPVVIPNATVDFTANGVSAGTAGTTNASGQFTFTASGVTAMTEYEFSVASTSAYTAATDDVTVAAVQAATRFTGLKVSPGSLSYRQKATLTGTVQYLLNGTTWTDLPAATVQVTEGKASVATATATSGGQFTATLPSTHGTYWTATLAAGNLIQQTSVTKTMKISVPVTITSFAASLQVNGKVSVSGCIQASDPIGYGPQPLIDIQYRASTHGGWKQLTSLQVPAEGRAPGSCRSAQDSYFSGLPKARLDDAYYRASFPVTPNLGIYSFGSAVSKAVHTSKFATKIVNFSVSRTSVKTGQDFSVSGELEAHVKNWKPWAGQKVSFWATDKGTAYTYRLGTAHTNSKGVATITVAGGDRKFVAVIFAVYAGNSTHLACQSRSIDVSNNGGSSTSATSAPSFSQAQLTQLGSVTTGAVEPTAPQLLPPGVPSLTSLLSS